MIIGTIWLFPFLGGPLKGIWGSLFKGVVDIKQVYFRPQAGYHQSPWSARVGYP